LHAKKTFKAIPLPEQIAEYLREKIIRWEYAPGQRIAELSLAEELNVSRGPIREAFRILEKAMLLELTPRHGARVTELSPSFIEALYDLLTELYSFLVGKAAETRTEEDLPAIEEVIQRAEEAAKNSDPEGYYEACFQYSSVARRVVGNPLVDRVLNELEANFRRTTFAIFSRGIEDIKKNAKVLRRMTQHIKAQEARLAAETMRTYFLNEKNYAMKIAMRDTNNSRVSRAK
jgi:DNA-binding GntR family transcriptional regulator